jgi:hypothetical protein
MTAVWRLLAKATYARQADVWISLVPDLLGLSRFNGQVG